jgi:hypothetical protein
MCCMSVTYTALQVEATPGTNAPERSHTLVVDAHVHSQGILGNSSNHSSIHSSSSMPLVADAESTSRSELARQGLQVSPQPLTVYQMHLLDRKLQTFEQNSNARRDKATAEARNDQRQFQDVSC